MENDECAKLRVEVERLREALEPPFAPAYQTCPKCEGWRKVRVADSKQYDMSRFVAVTCPVCEGAGVIERPKAKE